MIYNIYFEEIETIVSVKANSKYADTLVRSMDNFEKIKVEDINGKEHEGYVMGFSTTYK